MTGTEPLSAPFFPRVVLGPDYRARVERSTERLAAALARREGGGRSSLAEGGLEFAGHRPYRAGDDPRAIDWNLYARLGRPYVRVSRRDARERWRVVLDTSASMGVGPPGKLQRAAELAGALVLLGLRREAEVELAAGLRPAVLFTRRVPGALERLWRELESTEASAPGVPPVVAGARVAPGRAVTRLFWLGDPFGIEPGVLFAASERVRAAHVLHLCAPHELAAPPEPAAEWRDAESARTLSVLLDGAARANYARELERWLEHWRATARARGARHGVWSTELPFEDVLRSALGAG